MSPLFDERQEPHPGLQAVVAFAAAAPLALYLLDRASAGPAAFALSAALLLSLIFSPMRTTVDAGGVYVRFGIAGLIRRAIPLEEIVRAEPVTYRALKDYGGWGIRRSAEGERAYTMRGDQGVRLTLDTGASVLIGSRAPEALARAVTVAKDRADQ